VSVCDLLRKMTGFLTFSEFLRPSPRALNLDRMKWAFISVWYWS